MLCNKASKAVEGGAGTCTSEEHDPWKEEGTQREEQRECEVIGRRRGLEFQEVRW